MTDIDAFLDETKPMAAAAFLELGEHRPIFYMIMEDDSYAVLDAAWSDLDDKLKKFMTMRLALDVGLVKRCCLVHETWLAEYKVPKGQPFDVTSVPPPSQCADRKEMLMILAVDEWTSRLGHFEIKRDSEGRPTLGDFEIMQNTTMLSTAFRGLIKEGRPQ